MNVVTVYCHECGLLSERSTTNFLQSPYCITCGSDFVESLSESTAFEASPEPLPPHERILRGLRNPYFEDPFTSGLTERGSPYTLPTQTGGPRAMYRTMEDALLSLNPTTRPQNGARNNQRNGRSGSLTAMMDVVSLQVPPSRPPPSAPDPHSLKRELVCDRNGHLTRESCVVCREQYRRDESVITLPCDHVFHEDCVLRWLQDHDTCPVCRFKLPRRMIQSHPPIQNNRGPNAASSRSPAARGRNVNSSNSSGPALPNVTRNGPDVASRNGHRVAQANRTRSSRPSQMPSLIPYDVGRQEQRQRSSNRNQILRNEVFQIQDRETADHLTQQLTNYFLNARSNH